MNDRDLVDLYSQRREEYVALKTRVGAMKRDLQTYLEEGDMKRFRDLQMQADTLSITFHRVQDSMLFLEDKMCDILPKYRPEP
jgi:copper homeostasis protein CutC